MTVVDALRRARIDSGLSLRALAHRAGIAETNLSTIEHHRRDPTAGTVDRLAAALGVRLIPIATGDRATAADTAIAIAAHLRSGDTGRAYRTVVQLADDLDDADPYLRLLLTAERATTGDSGWDAFIAAVTEWRLDQAGLPAPAWTLASTNGPRPTWYPPGAVLPARPDHVAEPFRRRGVLVEADELASA